MNIDKEFEVVTIGKRFLVHVYDTYVIKIPRNKSGITLKELQFIADAHNYLSSRVDGILPCSVVEGKYLKMPKAKGERVDLYEERKFRTKNQQPLKQFKEHISKLTRNLLDAIEQHGYYLSDNRSVNMFYCEKEDKLYLIDFSGIRKRRDVNG